MRTVLIVIAIALVALGIGIALTPSKDLTPNPQDREDQIRQEQDRQEKLRDLKEHPNSAAASMPTSAGAPTAQPAANAPKAVSPSTASPGKSAAAPAAPAGPAPSPGNMQGAINATMSVAGRGDIVIALYPKAAPKTVAHFVNLIKSGFYNGILFHRVVPGFVVQAGDPASKSYTPQEVAAKDDGQGSTIGLGGGGSGQNVPFENSGLKNEPGTLAMALSGPQTDTGDSQFFINLVANPSLDGDYCVFGKVVKGMDVVNKIQRGDKITRMTVQ